MTPQRLRQRLDALPRRGAADAAAAYRAPRPAAFADPAARAFWSAQVGTDRACLATRGLPNGRELGRPEASTYEFACDKTLLVVVSECVLDMCFVPYQHALLNALLFH